MPEFDEKEKSVDFGFQTVSSEEKTRLVQDVFHRVAERYDVMNDAMSLGIHRLWKDTFASFVPLRADAQLLDVASGTGDIARRIQARFHRHKIPHALFLCDLNEDMLKAGRPEDDGLSLPRLCANAEALPVADNSMDAYTIAFGLRNITHKEVALAEAFRVLKPGGTFLCLEFSHVAIKALSPFYRAYLFNVVPWLGKKIAKDEASYRYLAESIVQFYDQGALAEQLKLAGFQHVSYHNLSLGIVAIHQGWKL